MSAFVTTGHEGSLTTTTTTGVPLRANLEQIQSAVNVECLQLHRLLWNLHDDSHDIIHRIRLALSQARRLNRDEESWRDSSSIESCISALGSELESLGEQIKWTCDSMTSALGQFLTLSQYQSHCKLILYSKLQQAKQELSREQIAILFHTSALIEACLELLVKVEEAKKAEGIVLDGSSWTGLQVFQLAQVYNSCLDSAWKSPVDTALMSSKACITAMHKGLNPTKLKVKAEELLGRVKVVIQLDGANHNDSPNLRLALKPYGASRILEQYGAKRSLAQSPPFCNVFETLSAGKVAPGAEQLKQHFSDVTEKAENIEGVLKDLQKVPALLPRVKQQKSTKVDGAALAEGKQATEQRERLADFFRHVLWTWMGEVSQDLSLWSFAHGRFPLMLKAQGTFELGGGGEDPNADGEMERLRMALRVVTSAVRSFRQLTSWDTEMMRSGAFAHKIKRPEQVGLERNPTSTSWSSDMARSFGDLVVNSLQLIGSSCERSAGANSSLESALSDEAAVLFRLDATLAFFNSWMIRRAKGWLNAWAIPQFIACSQRDSSLIVKCVEEKRNLLLTRQLLLTTENTSLRLSALHRQMCADDLFATLSSLAAMPEDLILAVGPVAQTLSLATLQSYMPPPSHWRGVGPTSGLDPDKPSPYVRVFIHRVIQPVIMAVVEFVLGPVQEALGKQVVQSACEAWLDFILQKRITFSEWGACQLLRDFMSIREWIRQDSGLESEARKAVLQLEILKRCEGVAYLLLRSPGDVLGVGKPSRKNRRVEPSESEETSPSASQTSVAEDDIPPEMYVPNQQMWLDLRLRRTFLTCCDH